MIQEIQGDATKFRGKMLGQRPSLLSTTCLLRRRRPWQWLVHMSAKMNWEASPIPPPTRKEEKN